MPCLYPEALFAGVLQLGCPIQKFDKIELRFY